MLHNQPYFDGKYLALLCENDDNDKVINS